MGRRGQEEHRIIGEHWGVCSTERSTSSQRSADVIMGQACLQLILQKKKKMLKPFVITAETLGIE